MTYLILLIITMIVSVVYSIQPTENTYLQLYLITISPILLTTLLGMIKERKTKVKYLILITSSYYCFMVYATIHSLVTSFKILIPLVLVPIFTAKRLNHVGLGNRMAMSFWFVLMAFMFTKLIPVIKPFALTFCVLLSYFLEALAIHTNEIETFSMNAQVTHDKKSIGAEYNPERFERPK